MILPGARPGRKDMLYARTYAKGYSTVRCTALSMNKVMVELSGPERMGVVMTVRTGAGVKNPSCKVLSVQRT